MLDLNKYLNRTLELKVGDKTIHVFEPSLSLAKEYFEKENSEPYEKFMETQTDLVTRMINRNREKETFTKEDIQNMPRTFVIELVRSLIVNAEKALDDPN